MQIFFIFIILKFKLIYCYALNYLFGVELFLKVKKTREDGLKTKLLK